MGNPSQKPTFVAALDESGGIIATYQGVNAHLPKDKQPKQQFRGYCKSLMDVFLPAGYPHTVTPDYTPYQIYDSLQAFASTIAGLFSSRAVLQGFGVGDATSTATSAILLTILQESTGRLATIMFAHRLGQAIEPECKFYRFVADILNDTAFFLDLLNPAIPTSLSYLKIFTMCCAGTLRALCGVAAGAAKASLSAHFARNGNLAELNAKDGSQETVISLLGMVAGSMLVHLVEGRTATMLWMFALVVLHLWTNYKAVRAVQMRSLNKQRACIVFDEYFSHDRILRPDEVAQREAILWPSWGLAKYARVTSFARTAPTKIGLENQGTSLRPASKYVAVAQREKDSNEITGQTICVLEGATTEDILQAWLNATYGLTMCSIVNDVFFQALKSAGWDLQTNALETGPAIRIRVDIPEE